MMSDYMNQVLSERNDVIFLVSTLSKQIQEPKLTKILEYGNRFTNLDPYLINSEVALKSPCIFLIITMSMCFLGIYTKINQE